MDNDALPLSDFRIKINGKFVRVHIEMKGTMNPLIASEADAEKASRFSFEERQNGNRYAIRCRDPKCEFYVRRQEAHNEICASGRSIEPSCRFAVNGVGHNKVTFQCDNKGYWTVDASGWITATEAGPNVNNEFEIDWLE